MAATVATNAGPPRGALEDAGLRTGNYGVLPGTRAARGAATAFGPASAAGARPSHRPRRGLAGHRDGPPARGELRPKDPRPDYRCPPPPWLSAVRAALRCCSRLAE